MARKYFGTDGIRGHVGEHPITPEFFLKLGWAVGKALAHQGGSERAGLVLIGKDTRISGYMFESALESGLISAGVDVGLLGPMPTPAIAYLSRTFHARAGIVISASHNPYHDNGIKLFNTYGEKISDELELEIERLLDEPMATSDWLGKARRIDDAEGRYIEFCKGSAPWGFTLSGMKIVLDCANGATYKVAPQIFKELGAKVVAIGASPNGININNECGSTHIANLKAAVKEEQADLGIAFDGDGDRVLFVDGNGELVDGDQILYVIAAWKKAHNGGCTGVVGTLMSNFGLEAALAELEIPFCRAKVGDRYVLEHMKKNTWGLGGESSGHIVCSDATTTGDGIISALKVLQAVKQQGQPLSELKQGMKMYPMKMINVPVARGKKHKPDPEVDVAVQEAEKRLAGTGRVLLRPSGTEPLIRVMVEGQDTTLVKELAEELAGVVKTRYA